MPALPPHRHPRSLHSAKLEMAAAATQPTPKGSGKKVASPVERANSPAPSAGSGNAADSQDDILESPHIKELQKYDSCY